MRFRNQNQNYKTVISLYTVQGIDFLEPLKLFMKIHCSSSFFGKKEKKSVTQLFWQNFNIKEMTNLDMKNPRIAAILRGGVVIDERRERKKQKQKSQRTIAHLPLNVADV